jgi:hypothetical protein
MDMTQYRITADGTVGALLDNTNKWQFAVDCATDRGLKVTLERRDSFAFDALFVECLRRDDGSLPKGMMVTAGRIIMPWQVIAEVDGSKPFGILVGD